MESSAGDKKYRAPALDKGLDIVELLADYADGLTLGDIARDLQRSQSEIYRMITTLVRRGYVVRSAEDDRFSLSLKMFALSHRHEPINRLLEYAPPKLRAQTRRNWQSCHMAMESSGDVVVVAAAESRGSWTLGLRVGSLLGLSNTAEGRILAAFRPPEELEELIDRHQLVVGEPAFVRSDFMEHLERIREAGYERMTPDTVPGIINLCYPVLDWRGSAAVALCCPFLERNDEMQGPSLDEVHESFLALSKELSAYYGGR